MRHLVSSAVTGLDPDSVTVVDGRGTVLAGDCIADGKAATPAARHGAQPGAADHRSARAGGRRGRGGRQGRRATFDSSEVETTADAYDPDGAAVRSEHKSNEQTNREAPGAAGVAGAAANQPGAGVPGGGGSSRGMTQREDETQATTRSRRPSPTRSRAARA